MRVVVDWHGKSKIADSSLIHLLTLLDGFSSGFEQMTATVLLNCAVPNIAEVRRALKALSSGVEVRVWYGDTDSAGCSEKSVATTIHEFVLRSLQPALVFVVFDEPIINGCEAHASICDRSFPIVADFRLRGIKTWQYVGKSAFEANGCNLYDLCLVGEKKDYEELASWGVAAEVVSGVHTNQILVKLTQGLLKVAWQPKANKTRDSNELPRLAFVCPLPPVESGIADHGIEVLAVLIRFYKIDVIVNQKFVQLDLLPDDVPLRDVSWFKNNSHKFDRICYQFGNSPHHAYMLDLIVGQPGVVVLHDFYLADLVLSSERTLPNLPSLNEALYHSHGYDAVAARISMSESSIVSCFPCNLEVIERSIGVITHSDYAERLMEIWYDDCPKRVKTVPLPRKIIGERNRRKAREILGFSDSSFVVCCFGVLGESKQTELVIHAWLESHLAINEDCHLLFVGQDVLGKYSGMLAELKIIGSERIHITGWVSKEDYESYLSAADMAIQLRIMSRGEASASLLDCLNYGVPTIANRHGFATGLPDTIACFLSESVSVSELARSIEGLWSDRIRRARLADESSAYVRRCHQIDDSVEKYAEAIEFFYKDAGSGLYGLLNALSARINSSNDLALVKYTATNIAQSFPRNTGVRQLLVDVTAIARSDLRTGIQRVVRSLLLELIKSPPPGFRVEPVYLSDIGGRWRLRYARSYTMNLLNCTPTRLADEPVDVFAGDVFLGLDLSGGCVTEAAGHSDVFRSLRQKGVYLSFVVYDLLPIIMPTCFPSGADRGHSAWFDSVVAVSDLLICISKAVADDVAYFMPLRVGSSNLPAITHFHLGADVAASSPTRGMPADADVVLAAMSQGVTFMMVGTVEPRKGHRLVLEAIERMWQDGYEVNLIIVGKQGWMMDKLVASIQSSSHYNKSLFWLPSVSDEYLEALYSASDCLIAASEGEGFGLPLIEAADKGIPVIARDIPVFREVAGNHAYFFTAVEPNGLAMELKGWLKLFGQRIHPLSAGMPRLTWKESAEQLKALITESIKPSAHPHTMSIGNKSDDQ